MLDGALQIREPPLSNGTLVELSGASPARENGDESLLDRIQKEDLVGSAACQGEVVRDDDDGGVLIAGLLHKKACELADSYGIEPYRRLVHDHELSARS